MAGAGTLAVVAGVLGAAHARWSRATTHMIDEMDEDAEATPNRDPVYSPSMLAGLPAPVARYFRFALQPGQPMIRRMRAHQAGLFATKRDQWTPFSADEEFSVVPPAFVWDAKIRVAPLISVHVRDSYIRGAGGMHGEVAAVLPVVHQEGTPEMAVATLQRYLAEAPWFPTALLPAAGVEWTAIDDSTARASLRHGGASASVDMHFGDGGEIVRVTADRYRDVDGVPALTPWEGRFEDYRSLEGMRVPLRAEVGWILDDGWFPYWRGRNVHIIYEYAIQEPVR
jgi:hypothetical protein